jgi:hypothetical protein
MMINHDPKLSYCLYSFYFNDKEEAKKLLRRAIDTGEAALQIDPTLAARESEDLNTKLKDARARLLSLTRVVPIPKADYFKYNLKLE